MQISDIKIRKMMDDDNDKMKAVVSVTFDENFVIHDIKVIEGEKGLFIAMPSKRTPEGEYRDIAHPINTGTRRMLKDAILEAYRLEKETTEMVAYTYGY